MQRALLVLIGLSCLSERAWLQDADLAAAFRNPPDASKVWCYWWWLNGAASTEGITRDFEEMKKQGIAGALLFDAGEAGPEAPRGPQFMSPEWRALFRHAVREADRFGLALGVNLCSGWNAGGPWVDAEHAAKRLVSAETGVRGGARVAVDLPRPESTNGYYRDLAVLAEARAGGAGASNAWRRARMVDVTRFVTGTGRLEWEAPAGEWTVLRIGCTLHARKVNCVGGGPGGFEIDPMSADAMNAHFAQTGAKLIADAGSLAGKSLQYFHIDSWELDQPTWTPRMREEFQRRRGYDPLLFLPALVHQTVDSAEITRRFLQDYRRTAADLIAAHYYGRLRELTVQGGLRGIHPESGGPFFTHWIDALQCEGINDIPMGEYWKRNWEPDGPIAWPPGKNPTIKQVASAAHIYGKPVCQAEAFTSFGDDWADDPWSMKDIGDAAFCHGLTRNVLCFYVHQPQARAKPGFQWAHVGTHFDRHLTWWDLSHAWFTYLARCQHVLRQGLFVADFAYLQGEEIPAFIAPRDQQLPARPLGFDYDVLNSEVLLHRLAVKGGRLCLPDGMSYGYLVCPQAPAALSPAAMRRLHELVESGATLIGAQPATVPGLSNYPKAEEEVRTRAAALWGEAPGSEGERRVGKGRVVWGRSLSQIVETDRLPPDVEFRDASPGAKFDWLHRRRADMDLYFLSNQSATTARVEVWFRVEGKPPALWDAVTGEIRPLPEWRAAGGRTVVPLEFAPRQSWLVVFQKRAERPVRGGENFPAPQVAAEIAGPWEVAFDPEWGGPERVTFPQLEDWIRHSEPGIRYYSGKAAYHRVFDLPPAAPGGRLYLDLGVVKNLARVRVNGREAGIVWTAPWRVEITDLVRKQGNELEIEVVNLWPNRLIGDATLPPEKRRTVTNVRTYDTMASGAYGCQKCEARRKSGQGAELLSSGLLGPVRLLTLGIQK